MPNALDVFREQLKAAALVYARVREVSELLAAVRQQVDGLTRTDELRELLKEEQRWLAEARQTVSELRHLREQEVLRFWPGAFRRWVAAVALALIVWWLAGAGYAWATRPYASELAALRARVEFVDSVERRVLSLTPNQRKQFEALMGLEKR